MSTGHQLLTAREFEQLTFERPTELVRGEIVEQEMPTSQHGSICALMSAFLVMWARAGKHGSVFSNDSHVFTEQDPDTVRGPDVAFIRRERLPNGKLPPGTLEIIPDLVVDILSPSDRWSKVDVKIEEYLTAGVREVWLIDPEARTISIQQLDQPTLRLREADTLERPQLLPGFSCPIAELFADI